MTGSSARKRGLLGLIFLVGCVVYSNSLWASRNTYLHNGYAIKDQKSMDPLGGNHDAKVELKDENNQVVWSENFCGDKRIAFNSGHYQIVLGKDPSNLLPTQIASSGNLFLQLSLYINKIPGNPGFCSLPDTPPIEKEEISGTIWAKESQLSGGLLRTITVNDDVTENMIYSLVLPLEQGGPDQVLTNDGAGNLRWADLKTLVGSSHTGQPTLSGCGEDSHFIWGTDRAGIIEIIDSHGSSPNGCTLTFNQIWYGLPVCVVSVYTGTREFSPLTRLMIRSISSNFFTVQRMNESGVGEKFLSGDTFGFNCFAPE